MRSPGVLVAVLTLAGCGAAPAVAAQCPSEGAWQRAVDSLGLLVIEPESHLVGDAPGNTKTWALANDLLGVGDNWFPLDIERKTLCGRADRWSLFEHWASGAEHDLHAHILPAAPFAYLLEESALVAGKLDQEQGCVDGCRPAIYSEVTPDKALRSGRDRLVTGSALGLPKEPAPFSAMGDLVCAYGPWVREKIHADIPEIHPSEVLWGVGRGAEGRAARTLLVVRDRSKRFERTERFAWSPGGWWRPWTSAGEIEVKIALSAGPGETPVVHITPLRPFDKKGSPRTSQLEAGDLSVKVVDETAVFSTALERVCLEDAGDRRAFLVLRTRVGEKGFVLASLRVEAGSLPPLPSAPAARRPVEERIVSPGTLVRDTLRVVGGRLVGTFVYEGPGGRGERRDEDVDLGGLGAIARIEPRALRIARLPVARLPRTADLWGMNPEAPGRSWSVASELRAELGLFLEIGSAERGSGEILAEEVGRVLEKKSRRQQAFGSARPFKVHWTRIRVLDLEGGRELRNRDLRAAGLRVDCFEGDLGTVGSCFPTEEEALERATYKKVGVLGGLSLDSSGLAAAQAPLTLKIVASGRVEGPLGTIAFEDTFLNHSPGEIVGGRLKIPRAWQLDEDGFVPGLLQGLAKAIWPREAEPRLESLRRDWQYDAAGLSQRLRTPVEREAALAELRDEPRRKARLFRLYGRASSREGTVSDCSASAPCGAAVAPPGPGGRSACDRLRDLACAYWTARSAGAR